MPGDWLISIIRDLTGVVYLAFSLRSFAMMPVTNERRQPKPPHPQPISRITMANDQRTYHAYLLRLWRVNTGCSMVWHASVEDSHTGERTGFAELAGLFTFLEKQTDTAEQLGIRKKGGQP